MLPLTTASNPIMVMMMIIIMVIMVIMVIIIIIIIIVAIISVSIIISTNIYRPRHILEVNKYVQYTAKDV